MTLQQKLLAKKSKKGFTLVELVVVIAILAVLAAIAIPAVIGIINSASQSSTQTDAASIDQAVKNYQAAITAGTVNASNKPSSIASYSVPAANAANGARTAYANNTATLEEAMRWDGIWDRLSSKVTGGDFGYADGSVVAAVDGNGSVLSSTAGGSNITRINGTTAGTTTLGTIVRH